MTGCWGKPVGVGENDGDWELLEEGACEDVGDGDRVAERVTERVCVCVCVWVLVCVCVPVTWLAPPGRRTTRRIRRRNRGAMR